MSAPTFELTAQTTLYAHLGRSTADYTFQPLPPQLPPDTPIFLDTNVLLGYYRQPLAVRPRLLDYWTTQNCYACDQVQREFKRHADKLQRLQRRHLQPPLALERHMEAIAELEQYVQQQARLLRAYPTWLRDWQQLLAEAKALTAALEAYNQRYLKQAHQLLRTANKTAPLDLLHPLPTISKRAYKQLKREFDQAALAAQQENEKGFDDVVAAFQYRYPSRVFPGLGDVLTKQKNPYGDYFIYHELLQWAGQDAGTGPVLFLTDDSTKGDWINASGEPYAHYQQHFLAQTQRVLYIAAAQPFWQQQLGVDATPLLLPYEAQQDVEKALWQQNAADKTQPITLSSVHLLLKRLWPTREQGGTNSDWQETVEYVQEATPYQSLLQLEGQLLRAYPSLLRQALTSQAPPSQLGALKQSIGMPF